MVVLLGVEGRDVVQVEANDVEEGKSDSEGQVDLVEEGRRR